MTSLEGCAAKALSDASSSARKPVSASKTPLKRERRFMNRASRRICYLSTRPRRAGAVELKVRFAVMVGDFLLGRAREVRMLPQVCEIFRELAVPVRDIRRVEKMAVADVVDRLRQQPLLGFQAEINLRLAHDLAGLFLQMRSLELAAQLPVFVHAVEPVRQPRRADLEERDPDLGEAHRNALENHAGEMEKHADGKCISMHLGEGAERAGVHTYA